MSDRLDPAQASARIEALLAELPLRAADKVRDIFRRDASLLETAFDVLTPGIGPKPRNADEADALWQIAAALLNQRAFHDYEAGRAEAAGKTATVTKRLRARSC